MSIPSCECLCAVLSQLNFSGLRPDLDISKRFKIIQRYFNKRSNPAFCAARTQVYTWGSGLQGQLGHGDYSSQAQPRLVEALNKGLKDDSIKQCSCGTFHTGCVTEKGKLFTWGSTQGNRLGHGNELAAADQPIPKDIKFLDSIKIVKVSCGDGHTLALSSDGQILSWGRNQHGQCGRSNSSPPPAEPNSSFSPVSSKFWGNDTSQQQTTAEIWGHRQVAPPLAVGFIEGLPRGTIFEDVCCGKLHSIGLSNDGIVYTWGRGSEGELGLGPDKTADLNLPTPIPKSAFGDQKVTKIASGFHFCAAVTEDGKLYTWGSDQYGQLGHGKESRRVWAPKKIRGLFDQRVVDIACGQYHIAATDACGQVFTWGYGRDGQLGHGERTDISIPTQVEKLGKGNRGVACGGGHTAVFGQSLWMMGRGRDGQLGRADHLESIVENRLEPVEVETFKNMKMSVLSAALGHEHSLSVIEEC